jgi:GNAT superfamily N-acetyltransferase
MAVLPEHRNQGLGRALVHAGLDIARDPLHQASPPPALAWCNARTTACAYYTKLGFTPRGGEFEIDGIGPHFVMVRELPSEDPCR